MNPMNNSWIKPLIINYFVDSFFAKYLFFAEIVLQFYDNFFLAYRLAYNLGFSSIIIIMTYTQLTSSVNETLGHWRRFSAKHVHIYFDFVKMNRFNWGHKNLYGRWLSDKAQSSVSNRFIMF